MKRRFIPAAQWLLAGLMALTLLGGLNAAAATANPPAQTGIFASGFYPRTIDMLDYDPRGYAGGEVAWLQIGDDWLAYARQSTPGCGHCGSGIEAIELYNTLTGQHQRIRSATWGHTYPNGFEVVGLDRGSLHLNRSLLIWEQPSPTLPKPQDPRETYTYVPGQFACTLCYYDLRTGQGGALTALEAQAAPDPSRARLLDLNLGHVLALLPDPAGDRFWISDLPDGSTKAVADPVAGSDVQEAFLESNGLWIAWLGRQNHVFLYDSPGKVSDIAPHADSLYLSGTYLVWFDGQAFHYTQSADEPVGVLPPLAGFDPKNPYALDPNYPAVAWPDPTTDVLDVMAFGPPFGDPGSTQLLLHSGVSGAVDQIWVNQDKLVFVTEQPGGSGVPPTYALQLAWLTTPDPAFAARWEQADGPVARGEGQRSWLWGPAPLYVGKEQYNEVPAGSRLVEYYDKSRMEVNQPSPRPEDKAQPYYVTNGLLVVEMIEGRIRIGDTAAITASVPATIPVAGDARVANPLTPDYATLRGVASLAGDHQAPNRIGQPVNEAIDAHGVVSAAPPTSAPAHYAVYAAETNHNIPDVFWMYLQGMQGAYGFDWVYVFGYPITEAYWTSMRVDGKDYPVLIQAYQRRVLTYAPDFPAGWQVQQGNVGQHYYEWRYVLNR